MSFDVNPTRTAKWRKRWQDSDAFRRAEWVGALLEYTQELEDLVRALVDFDYVSGVADGDQSISWENRYGEDKVWFR